MVLFLTDFSTADLTISMDLSKLTSPCGVLYLLIAAVGCVLVFAVLIIVEEPVDFTLCKTDISTSERGIFNSGIVSLEDTSESVTSSCEEAIEAGEGDLEDEKVIELPRAERMEAGELATIIKEENNYFQYHP